MKKQTELLNDIQFHELNEEWLGSESEDYDGDDNDNDDMSAILSMNQKDEDEEITPMQSALKVLNEDYRKEEMENTAITDMSINEYKVEPATNQCMTDFFEHDYPEPEDKQALVSGDRFNGEAPAELPLNFYDNDDGFWDNYINERMLRNERAGMITNRKYFIH